MKKLFIIGAALSLFNLSAEAQDFDGKRIIDKCERSGYIKAPNLELGTKNNANNKTTGPGGSRVMNAVEDLYLGGDDVYGWLGLLFNDSTGYVVYSNDTASAWWNYGLEQIYAPFAFSANDESVFTDDVIDLSIQKQNNITVDTIKIYGIYYRNDNTTTDSLIINFSTDVADFPGYRSWDPFVQSTYNVDTLSFRTMDVDTATNEAILPSGGLRFAIPLDASTLADTTADGFNVFSIPVGQSTVNATYFGVAMSFKYTGNWNLGDTILSNLNYFRPLVYEQNQSSSPKYVKGETFTHAGSLTQQNKYDGFLGSSTTNNKYIPMWFYGAGSIYEFPYIDYVVSCADCDILSLKDNQDVAIGEAYPNPATDQINIPVIFKDASNVSVSISNVLGQEVSRTDLGRMSGTTEAKVNTSNLENGIYFATIVSNGVNVGTIKFTVK